MADIGRQNYFKIVRNNIINVDVSNDIIRTCFSLYIIIIICNKKHIINNKELRIILKQTFNTISSNCNSNCNIKNIISFWVGGLGR